MALPNLPPDFTLVTLKEEDNFSRSKHEANPVTVTLAVPFTNFIAESRVAKKLNWRSARATKLKSDKASPFFVG